MKLKFQAAFRAIDTNKSGCSAYLFRHWDKQLGMLLAYV